MSELHTAIAARQTLQEDGRYPQRRFDPAGANQWEHKTGPDQWEISNADERPGITPTVLVQVHQSKAPDGATAWKTQEYNADRSALRVVDSEGNEGAWISLADPAQE